MASLTDLLSRQHLLRKEVSVGARKVEKTSGQVKALKKLDLEVCTPLHKKEPR